MKKCVILTFSLLFCLQMTAQPTDSLTAEASIAKNVEENNVFASTPPSKDSVQKIEFTAPVPEESAEVYTHEAFQPAFLIGKWAKMGENHFKEVLSFDDEAYHLEKFFIDSESKMEENYLHYTFMKDSVVLNGIGLDETKAAFWIRKLTPDTLVLQDPETFDYHKFTRISTDMPAMPVIANVMNKHNGKLECMIDANTPAAEDLPCMHIADLNFSWTLDSLETKFGHPVRFVQSKKDSSIAKFVFHLTAFQGTQPELIVTHNSATDEISEIQLRGFGTNEDYNFSSIRLGDYISLVEQKLGKPSEKVFDNETLTTKWSYAPYPLVFEFKNKYVNGIKIYKRNAEENK